MRQERGRIRYTFFPKGTPCDRQARMGPSQGSITPLLHYPALHVSGWIRASIGLVTLWWLGWQLASGEEGSDVDVGLLTKGRRAVIEDVISPCSKMR